MAAMDLTVLPGTDTTKPVLRLKYHCYVRKPSMHQVIIESKSLTF